MIIEMSEVLKSLKEKVIFSGNSLVSVSSDKFLIKDIAGFSPNYFGSDYTFLIPLFITSRLNRYRLPFLLLY